jgi:hypothetical protein
VIDHLVSLLVGMVYVGGLLYAAPRLAAREAEQRGRTHVHNDDAVVGVAKGLFWFLFLLVIWTRKKGDVHLGKYPEVRARRVIEAHQTSERMDRALKQSLEEE